MNKFPLKKSIISFYLVYFIIISGFLGFFIFERVDNEVVVSAITVNDDGGADYLKIQDAIDNAPKGAMIFVWAGTYNENIIVNKSVTLIGNGTINTTINGGGIGDVVVVSVDWVNITGFTIKNSGINGSPDFNSGIKLDNVENVTINNVNCSDNRIGIYFNNSHFNKIYKTICDSNWRGIFCYKSKFNNLTYNKCNSNNLWGFMLILCDFNYICNNTCNNNKMDGIRLEISSNNSLINNKVNSNSVDGISIMFSNYNNIFYNLGNSNIAMGILISYNSHFNSIKNNTCNKNYHGIYIGHSSYSNTVFKNNCHSNIDRGIIITWNSSHNQIKNNLCLNNSYGISIDDSPINEIYNNSCKFNNNGIYILNNSISGDFNSSEFNIIKNNTFSNNSDGIVLEKVDYNKILNNTISNNTNFGFSIDSNCADNYLYYNHILFNNNQASDSGSNFWNNSAQEGNYWSDYNGLDTGYMTYGWDVTNKHQIAGDGIGDTLVPHLGLDYYPFTNKSGWLKPGTPILDDPGDFDNDGDYNLSWVSTVRTIGYILIEDNKSSFDSPTEIYNGSMIIFNITDKSNGTYYYRVKAYNEKYESPWSNIVDIIVDWIPSIPKNLNASTYPPGNTLNLTWDLNLVDTKEYILEYKNETMLNWQQINPILHPGFTFYHTGLIDGEKYYYRIQARDHRGQLSNFSNIISGIPRDSVPPAPPTGLRMVSTTNDSISLKWNPNAEEDLEGYHLFKSELTNPSDLGEPIGTIPKGTEEFIDNGLDEKTTYYYVLTAFDEVPNNSSYSNIVFGNTLLGPHGPVINNSLEDFSISEDTIDDSTIKLYRWFKDINNDPLEFKCEGNKHLNVTIDQQNGNVTLKPEKDWNGKETLIFSANDSIVEIFDNVTITITPVNDPPGPAVIITPKEGIKVENGTKINFSAICDDVDLIYGDKLTFNWSSNISGGIGSGENLTDIILPPGVHMIILKVLDIIGETAIDTVNITILPELKPNNNVTPKFDLNLLLIPNIVELKPGDNKSIKAVVTNLGNLQDEISLTYNIQNGAEIEVSIIGDQKKIAESNKTAEFEVNIKALGDAKKGELIATFAATSGNAIDHELEVKKNTTLTIKILEEKDTSKEDNLTNLWWIIILIIVIIIIIILFILIRFKKKKESPEEELKQKLEGIGAIKPSPKELEDATAELSQEE